MSRVALVALPLAMVAGCRAKPTATTTATASTTTTATASTTTTATASTTSVAAAVEPMGDAARGKELVNKFECARCHDFGPDAQKQGIAAIDPTRHCVKCHQEVMAGKFDAKPDAPKWKKHVAHLIAVPSLTAVGRRLSYGWLARFIAEPHKLRPALTQMMPRLGISREQARDVAAFLVSIGGEPAKDAGAALAGADPTRGRKLIDDFQCGSCHRMTGAPALGAATPLAPPVSATYERGAEEARPAVMLAPDLRFARDRMNSAALVAWLLDPAAIKPDTPMPRTPMSPSLSRDVAAYLLRAPLDPAPAYRVPAALPALHRRVGYDEVAREVLDVTCRHCHGNPDVALGDGGPGNSGGFGFAPRGVNFTSYEQVNGGFLDEKGERHSLFEPTVFPAPPHGGAGLSAEGTPRLVAALWARHREIAGRPDPNVRGMPLGLPPLPPEQIQLIATWVAQGRPR